VPTLRPRRPHRLAVALLAAAACATPSSPGSGAGSAPSATVPTAPEGGSPEELAALHDRVRVAGLDDRAFGPETYGAILEPLLEGWHWEVAGESAEGRPIRHVTLGQGPIRVLLWSQMHGNESTASMALVDLFRFFQEHPEHPVARRILEGSTLHVVPLLNPDGAARFRRRNAQGIDINRDARRLETPEGRTLKAVRDAVEPHFGFNLHDQDPRSRVGDADRSAAIALLAPAFNPARDIDQKRHRAMQVSSLLVHTLRPLVGDHIAKYDDTFNPRAFGDLMGAWGASTILIESGGWWDDDPQKQHLRKANFVGLLSALDGIATGAYEAYGAETYQELAYNGPRLNDLLVLGGTLAIPGLPTMEADLLVEYGRPLLRRGGIIDDIGDLGEEVARDTLRADGLYVVPLPEALGPGGALDAGAPAWFVLAEDPGGAQVRTRFEGGR